MVRPIEQAEPIDVDTLVFDTVHSCNNPFTDEEEYEALKESISRIGQTDSVIRYWSNGQWVCGDGRHRAKACKELGIKVYVRDIPKEATDAEVALVMLGTSNSRNETVTQKAIKAYRSIDKHGLVAKDACKLIGVRSMLVSFVSSIIKYGQESVLEDLFQGKKLNVGTIEDPKWTSSLEVIARWAKTEYESSRVCTASEVDDYRIQWKEDGVIKTEAGKAWYYEIVNTEKIPNTAVTVRKILAEKANELYRIENEN